MKRKINLRRCFYLAAALIAMILLVWGVVLLCTRGGDDSGSPDSIAEGTATTTASTTTGTDITTTQSNADTTVSTTTTAVTKADGTAVMITTAVPAPETVMLDVPYYSQNGLLPTGCELISAKMVMEFYGATPTINEIVENTFSAYTYMDGGKNYGYHPEDAFIGSPWDETSFGCFPPVMCDMMNTFLPEGKTAVYLKGESLSEIAETYLSQGKPVMVWATMYMKETYGAIGWYLLDSEGNQTDEWYFWPAREHCLVLVGYDAENYYFNDPMQTGSPVAFSRSLVETRYAEMGSRALVVHE